MCQLLPSVRRSAEGEGPAITRDGQRGRRDSQLASPQPCQPVRRPATVVLEGFASEVSGVNEILYQRMSDLIRRPQADLDSIASAPSDVYAHGRAIIRYTATCAELGHFGGELEHDLAPYGGVPA